MMQYPISVEEAYPFSDEKSVPVVGEASLILSAVEKRQLLQAWQRFLWSGFKQLFFDEQIYRFISHYCDMHSEQNRDTFWHTYFSSDVARLHAFLGQFCTDRRSVAQGNQHWLDGPAADLKEAMCHEAIRLYAPLNQVLQDLQYKYEEMIAAWYDFALAAHITDAPVLPTYQVSENTRNLLAYAAYIALRQQRPLAGLQLMLPVQQPLLQPVPAEGNDLLIINPRSTP